MTDKQKPKKLDCWLKLTGETSEHFVTALQYDFESEKSYKEAVRYFKKSFEYALTQQRTGLLEEINNLLVELDKPDNLTIITIENVRKLIKSL